MKTVAGMRKTKLRENCRSVDLHLRRRGYNLVRLPEADAEPA
jgi:hypothetical protein